MNSSVPRTALIAIILTVQSSYCLGQADFSEDFENIGTPDTGEHGPSGLIAAGWTFQNQSDPTGGADWDRPVCAKGQEGWQSGRMRRS